MDIPIESLERIALRISHACIHAEHGNSKPNELAKHLVSCVGEGYTNGETIVAFYLAFLAVCEEVLEELQDVQDVSIDNLSNDLES